MASYPHAVRLPESQPQVVEVNAKADRLPKASTKPTKFVIKLGGVIPM